MEDIICSGCSLLCDDVSAMIEDGELKSLGLCRLGHAHLTESYEIEKASATIREDGKTRQVTLEDGISHAIKILKNSQKSTLLYGWTNSSNETIKEGLLLAESLGAQFEALTGMGANQSMAHNIHGFKLDVDLEYVRNNGEFIIYWGSDPTESLHRHPSRFAVLPRGDKIPEGIESRIIGVVDVRETETMKMANHRIKIPVGTDAEFIQPIISELSGKESITKAVLGIPAAEMLGLVRGLQKSDCTVIFYGSGILNSGHAQKNLQALKELIDALRSLGKEAYAFPMFPGANSMGAITALKDAASGSNVFLNIINGSFGSALIVDDDVLAAIPGPAAKALAGTSIIYIGSPGTFTDSVASVSFHLPNPITSGSGSMHRIDMISTEFKPWQGSKSMVSKAELLSRIREGV